MIESFHEAVAAGERSNGRSVAIAAAPAPAGSALEQYGSEPVAKKVR